VTRVLPALATGASCGAHATKRRVGALRMTASSPRDAAPESALCVDGTHTEPRARTTGYEQPLTRQNGTSA